MTDYERLNRVLKHLNISANKLSECLGLPSAQVFYDIKKGRHGISKKLADAINGKYFNINTSWLLTGEGEMLKETAEKEPSDENQVTSGKLIPFYDVDAAAGTHYEMNMNAVSRPIGMIEIGSVLRDSESAIRVYGNSMIPNYPAGCVIGLKLHCDSFIEPGCVYVVETNDNRYLKRLYYNDDKTCFHCLSDNQMKYEDGARKGKLYYQDFEIPIEEVIRLHRVVGVIKRNIL